MIDELTWEPLFVLDLDVDYEHASLFGATPLGSRGFYPVRGGTFTGPRLNGVVAPGGSDWVTHRVDGVMTIDVRLPLRTDDGAYIAMSYTGLARAKDEALMARFRERQLLTPEQVYLRTTPRFETGHEDYAWLNGIVAVGSGERTAHGGRYHVFAIT